MVESAARGWGRDSVGYEGVFSCIYVTSAWLTIVQRTDHSDACGRE